MRIIVRVLAMASCIGGLLLAAVNSSAATANPPVAKPAEPSPQMVFRKPATTPAPSPATGEEAEPATEASFEVTDRYTAQRRPRVTVLAFDDTNIGALDTRYGSSVEAMLVTFLKRKSQFVVVERQRLDRLLAEKQRLQTGMVQINPDDKESRALLEKIDLFVLGSVTLLDNSVPPEKDKNGETEESTSDSNRDADTSTGKESEDGTDDETDEEANEDSGHEDASQRAKKLAKIQGPRIEIDVKLISRFDGRIIAAAQRSGPVACLRSIVERLGVALEQEFLRPYYGKLTVNLNEPEHIRVFLTPILPEDALDEEKPPVERSTTVTIAGDHDIVEPWTTDPTTYTIKNVLSGWYSMRIERPGYSPIGVENARWEVRKRLGKEIVFDRAADLPMDKVDLVIRRFVVRVDPLATEVVEGNALGFTFRKEGGSIAPLVKRQYMDEDFAQAPQRVILMGGEKIELNMLKRPDEYADDERCDLFEERKPHLANYGRTYVTAGQSFNFDQFTGGELIIEDYQGEVVPVGVYRMALWEPSYKTEVGRVTVHDRDDKKQVKTSLTRETAALSLAATGPRPANQVVLEGRETRHRIELPLDFEKPKDLQGIPADGYLTTTNITDLDGWQINAVVPASNVTPPRYNINSKRNKPEIIEAPRPAEEPVSRASVKTRFGLAGRLETLSRRPDPLAADLFIDEDFGRILNLLLYGVTDRPGEERGGFLKAAAEAGGILAPFAAGTLSPSLGLALMQVSRPRQENASPRAPEPGTPGQPAPPVPDPFPRDPELLRKLLAERLEVLDLVVLDPVDMVQLQRSPEVAAILARYVASGGSLFAYVSSVGDYRQVIGAPLSVETMSKRTRRLGLAPGEVDGLIPKFDRKDVKVKARRALPEVADLPASWRTLAYTRGGRRPRIIETGGREQGGYVALWLDDPHSFRGHWGGTRPKVEETRGRVEDHVLQRARALMRRRFDRTEQAQQPCVAPNPLQAASPQNP